MRVVSEARSMSLGHGFVELDTVWGTDESIVRIAGISYNKDYTVASAHDGVDNVRLHTVADRLIPHLIQLGHWSPFEFAGSTIKVRAPIFVSRQWFRHRSLSYMEESRRYTANAVVVSAPKDLEPELQAKVDNAVLQSAILYRELLTAGVRKEAARTILLLGTYTTFFVSGNLRNWCHFLRQRMAKETQEALRNYANEIFRRILQVNFPITANALEREFFPGGL